MPIVSWSLVALVAATSLQAQAKAPLPLPPPRTFTLVRELRMSAATIGLTRDAAFAVGRDGRMVLGSGYEFNQIKGFDSAGADLGWVIPTGRGGDVDIGYPRQIGWVGRSDTMWVNDIGFGQVALVNARGTVIKSIEYPSWVHPTWAERRTYPVFGRSDTYAVYGDQTMLVLPSRPRSFIATPGFDRDKEYLMRTTWSGAIQRVVASRPLGENRIVLDAPGCDHVIPLPYTGRTNWSVSNDGTRISVIVPGNAPADSGTVHLVAVDDRGDTVFSRRYPQTAVRNSGPWLDEYLSRIEACGSLSAVQLRDSVKRRTPAFRSLTLGVVTGHDRSAWITLRAAADTSRERTALVIDAQGALRGTVALPFGQAILAVDRDHIWLVEPGRSRGPAALVRYRLEVTGVPRARTAPASTSSPRARPPG